MTLRVEVTPHVGLLGSLVELDGTLVGIIPAEYYCLKLKVIVVTGFGTPNFGLLKDIVLRK